MDLIRRWIFRPKRSDSSLLAQFFYADRDLNLITDQLEKFDGHKNVEQFSGLITELRKSQDSLLSVIEKIMDEIIPELRASRDFRVKFPDDILQESLAGRLWFGAECLAAGSSIINHEVESLSMQPLAKLVTKQLGRVRTLLREQSLRSTHEYTDEIRVALTDFDNSFAEFELCYVSAMVPVKTMKDYDLLQEVAVLFSETVQRSLRLGWLSQEQLEMYDPALMFTIPRLAVICGLLVYPEGPLNPDMDSSCMSEMFRPFQQLLHRIRDLLWTLNMKELWVLEMLLSKGKDPAELNDMTCYEDLDRLACPWTDGAYDCGPIAERTRFGAEKDAGTKYRPKVTSPTLVAGSGRDAGGLSEIGEFFAEVVRSCIHEDRRELSMTLDISAADDGSRQRDESEEVSSMQKQTIFSGVLNSDNLDSGAVKCESSVVASITSYDTSHDCNSPRTDPNQLSNQVTGAICVSDCSTIQRICCGCPDATSMLDPSVGSGNPDQHPAVPAEFGVGESNERTDECPSRASEEQASSDEKTMEDDGGSVLLCDSLEVSQSSRHASSSSSGAGFGYDWDRESYKNLFSNSNSICCDENDEESMMLAIEVAETAAREEMQSLFRDSMDLIHRLFVCISGIADQLQTNFACDLRHILKAVFDSNTSFEASPKVVAKVVTGFNELDNLSPVVPHPSSVVARPGGNESTDRPRWIPDDESPFCMSCQATFTFVRRRHHCRNCGKVFCGQCSPNTVPLPHYGHEKPVRVCNHCFLFCVTPFTISN